MDLGLSQRVALVTGASSGLGLAISRALAAEGCAVAMVARRAEMLDREARHIIAQAKGRALPLAGDVTRSEDVARVASEAAAMLGPIDILIANAGGPPSTTRRSRAPSGARAFPAPPRARGGSTPAG